MSAPRSTSGVGRCALVVGALAGAAIGVGACDDGAREEPPWGRPAFPTVAAVDPRVADLGRLLFYDPVLSSDGQTACATCHSELWGMSDGLPTSIGVGGGLLTGPGRKGGTALTRNAPTLWNVVLRATLFLDGRETTLERQVTAPLHSPIELGKEPEDVLVELRAIPEYVARFADAFPGPDDGEPVTEARFRTALADFQRTLVSDDSLYDAYVAGDLRALDETMKEGMRLLDALDCVRCHTPPTFDVEGFAARGIGDGSDRGRAEVSGRPEDEAAFRVPTLRNTQLTEPFFHDGSAPTLRDAIVHEVRFETGRAPSEAEVDALAAFIGRALIDRSREPDRPEHVPSGLPVPIDGFRVLRP